MDIRSRDPLLQPQARYIAAHQLSHQAFQGLPGQVRPKPGSFERKKRKLNLVIPGPSIAT